MSKIELSLTENEANQLIDALVFASLSDDEYKSEQREQFTKLANRVRDTYMNRHKTKEDDAR